MEVLQFTGIGSWVPAFRFASCSASVFRVPLEVGFTPLNSLRDEQSSIPAAPGGGKVNKGKGVVRRRLVQACCERENLLSANTPESQDCEHVWITAEEHFTSERGIKMAIDAIKGPGDALFYAGPCVGGCKRNVYNMTKNENIMLKVLAHQKDIGNFGIHSSE